MFSATEVCEEPPERRWPAQYEDEVSGAARDAGAGRTERELEVEYMPKLKVYEEATHEVMRADGCQPVSTTWIEINNGDATHVEEKVYQQETSQPRLQRLHRLRVSE